MLFRSNKASRALSTRNDDPTRASRPWDKGRAGLSVTLVPVLMGYWIRGPIPDEKKNPINRGLIRLYQPALDAVLRRPKTTLAVALLVFISALWPMSRLGGEFLTPLDEGDLLYMPSALPGLSAQKAAQLLQLTDRLIKTVPEVARVGQGRSRRKRHRPGAAGDV